MYGGEALHWHKKFTKAGVSNSKALKPKKDAELSLTDMVDENTHTAGDLTLQSQEACASYFLGDCLSENKLKTNTSVLCICAENCVELPAPVKASCVVVGATSRRLSSFFADCQVQDISLPSEVTWEDANETTELVLDANATVLSTNDLKSDDERDKSVISLDSSLRSLEIEVSFLEENDIYVNNLKGNDNNATTDGAIVFGAEDGCDSAIKVEDDFESFNGSIVIVADEEPLVLLQPLQAADSFFFCKDGKSVSPTFSLESESLLSRLLQTPCVSNLSSLLGDKDSCGSFTPSNRQDANNENDPEHIVLSSYLFSVPTQLKEVNGLSFSPAFLGPAKVCSHTTLETISSTAAGGKKHALRELSCDCAVHSGVETQVQPKREKSRVSGANDTACDDKSQAAACASRHASLSPRKHINAAQERKVGQVGPAVVQLHWEKEKELRARSAAETEKKHVVRGDGSCQEGLNVLEGPAQHAAARNLKICPLPKKNALNVRPGTEQSASQPEKVVVSGFKNVADSLESTSFLKVNCESKKESKRFFLWRGAEQRLRPSEPTGTRGGTQTKDRPRPVFFCGAAQGRGKEKQEEVTKGAQTPKSNINLKTTKLTDRFGRHRSFSAAPAGSPPPKSKAAGGCGTGRQKQAEVGAEKSRRVPATAASSLPEFLERNAELLRRRQRRAEYLRGEMEKKQKESCTFKPQTNLMSSRRCNMHNRDQLRSGGDFQTSTTRFGTATQSSIKCVADVVDENNELSVDCLRQVKMGYLQTEISFSCSSDDDNSRAKCDDGSLMWYIWIIEKMLLKWKQLEAQYTV